MPSPKAITITALALLSSVMLSANIFAGPVRAIPVLPDALRNVASDEIAIPINLVKARYPHSQAASKIETVVWVKAFVNKQGEVEKAIVAFSDGTSTEFEIAALSATFASQFQPGERRGKPSYKWFYHPVIFDKKMAKKARKAIRAAKAAALESNGDSENILVKAQFAVGSEDYRYPGPEDYVAAEIMPEMTKEATLRYPSKSKADGVEGVVWVKALIDESGTVKAAFAGKSSGDANLDRAALNAAARSKFSPAMQNGEPLAVWISYKVEFRLDSD